METSEASLAAGDKQKAALLINQLAWADKRLKAVGQQGTAEWKAARKRYDALLLKLQAKRDGAPAPKPSSKKGTQKGGQGGTPPAPSGKTPPQPAMDYAKLVSLNEDVQRAFEQYNMLRLKQFKDANRVRGLQSDARKLRERITTFPKSDSNVQIVAGNITKFEGLIEANVAKVAAHRAAAPDITARLDSLFDKYDKAKFPLYLERPYSEPQLRAWGSELYSRRSEKMPADLKWLQSVADNVVVKDGSVNAAIRHIEGQLTRELNEAELTLMSDLETRVKRGLSTAEYIAQLNPKSGKKALSAILDRGAAANNMLALREAEHQLAMLRVLDEVMNKPSESDRNAKAATIKAAVTRLKELSKLALQDVRMPTAVSEDPELLKAAAETLKRDKYEVGDWLRLVINYDVREKQRREAYADRGVVRTTITFYDYKWREFQVTTAEEEDGEVLMYANTLKFYSSGDSTTPVGRWILSDRIELTPIAKENVGK